ncbi:hypothetical protein [Mesorhizobium sp. CAU 1741]|uniref:hypothetical protein n=1 Tax=Mesorhizobium sp. CAU 1741 TaxID=3140366 RepID=UPI00325C1820
MFRPVVMPGVLSGWTIVIQTALFFILGFLSAGFLALLVAPSIWRRAVALTRRRLESTLPLSMAEIQADKDRVRAENAIAVRQLEMKIKTLREKSATQQVELGRNHEELLRLGGVIERKDQAAAEARSQIETLREESRLGAERIATLTEEVKGLESRLTQQKEENERLGRMYDDASFSASSRQIEIVAQESKLEKLSEDVSALRAARKEADAQLREAKAEAKASSMALRDERKKSEGLEKKLAAMTSSLADSDDKLERRLQELRRLREELKEKALLERTVDELKGTLADREDKLERRAQEMKRLREERETEAGVVEAGGLAAEERRRMEDRLTRMTQENRKLRAALDETGKGSGDKDKDKEKDRENAALRERIAQLAAEVVNLTAVLDGPDSPVWKALGELPARPQANGGAQPAASLAERIRALRDAAAGRPQG